MNDTLHLAIKKKWFDMIVSGEKREEYRDVKPYWEQRLSGKTYKFVKFRNGYRSDSPTITKRLTYISVGLGHVTWGAPDNKFVFRIGLGDL